MAATSDKSPWQAMQVASSTVTTVALVAGLSPMAMHVVHARPRAPPHRYGTVTQVTPSASWATPWGQAESVADAASAVWQVTQSDSIVQFTG